MIRLGTSLLCAKDVSYVISRISLNLANTLAIVSLFIPKYHVCAYYFINLAKSLQFRDSLLC